MSRLATPVSVCKTKLGLGFGTEELVGASASSASAASSGASFPSEVSPSAALLAEEFARIDGIEAAFLYGSFAARMRGIEGTAPNDVDVMVIGSPEPDSVYGACDRVEELVHRPVNPTILSPEEAQEDSGFLDQVRNSPIVPIIGGEQWP